MAAVLWLLAVCYGAILSSSDAWRPKQEFEFSVSGRSVVHLPSVSKFMTGIHYRGRIVVQTQGARMLVMKMVNMSYSNFHLELLEGAWQNLSIAADESHSLSLSDEVFIVSLQSSGLINSMTVNSQLSENDVNFLQGIASQFQFDLMGVTSEQTDSTNYIHGRGNYSQAADFRIMEDSVAGSCEVRYEVNPSAPRRSTTSTQARLCGNRPSLEVLKSRNYDRCSREAEYHAGLPGSLGCTASSTQCAEVWSRAALTRVMGCGDRKDFLMLGSFASSKVIANLHLHNNSEAVMDSFVRLDLLEARPLNSHFSPPESTRTLNELRYLYSAGQDVTPLAPISMPTLEVEQESQLETGFTRNVRQAAKNMNNTHESKVYHRKYDGKKKKSKEMPPTTASPPATVVTTSKTTFPEPLKPSRNVTPQAFMSYPDRPFSAMFLSHRAPDDRACMVQQLKKQVSEIADELESPQSIPGKRTMEKINVAIEICRTMTLTELQKAVENAMDVDGREIKMVTERKILRDVVKMCGTVPAFEIAKSWIETKKVTGQEACDILATIPRTLLTPNVFVVQSFYDLVRSAVVRDDEQLKITSALSFNNLLRVACVKEEEREARFPATSLGAACTPQDAAHYLQWFKSQLKTDPALRDVYLFALGNSASPTVMASLRAAALDKTYKTGVRATAVLAMKELMVRDANATVPTLLHLYQDSTQPLPVRLAAAALLVFSRSSPVVWQRLAMSTWFERSPAICAFVWSSLSTLAQTRDPVLKPMAHNAARVLLLAKPMRLGIHLPYNTVWTSVTTELRQVLLNHFSYSPIRDTSHLYYRYIQRMAGISTGGFESEVWVSSPDDFLSLLYDFLYPSQDLSQVRPAQEGILLSTRWIREKLKIAQRNMPRINGRLRFKYNGLQEQLFPFDRNIFSDLAKEGRTLVDEMQTGKNFHLQNMNMDEMVMSTTTEMGFPLSFQLRRVWAGRTVGQAIVNGLESSLKFNVSAMFSQQMMAELSFFVGWDSTQHVAASHAVSVAQLPPLQAEAALRANRSQLALGTQMLVPTNEAVTLLRHSTVPFTAQVDTLNLTPISLGRNTRLQFDINNSGDQMQLGPASLTYKSQGAQKTLNGWFSKALTVFGQPMMWPTLHHGDLRVALYPLPAVTVNVSYGDAETCDGSFRMKKFPKPLLNHTEKETSLIQDVTQLEGSLIETTLRTTSATTTAGVGTISGETTEQSLPTGQTTTEQSATVEETTTVTETALSLESNATAEPTPEGSTVTTETTPESASNETTPETTNETTPETTNETTPETTNETTAETTNETTAETTTESVATETASTETTVEAMTTVEASLQSTELNLTTTEETHSPTHFNVDPLQCSTESSYRSTPLEGEFNATELDPFSDEVNGSRVAYLLQRVLAGIPDGRSFALEVNASIQTPSPTLLRAMLTLGESKNGSTFRKGLFLRSEAHTWQTFLTGSVNVPSVPLVDALKLLETNLSTTLTVDWVVQINDTRFVFLVKSNAVRSDKRTNYLKLSEDFEHCSKAVGATRHVNNACRSLAEAASTLNSYDTTVAYNDRVLETLWGPSPSDASRTRLVVELSDEENAVDLGMRTPTRDREEKVHVVLDPLVMSAMRLNPTCSYWDGFGFSAYCGVGGGHVRTYDGLEFDYALDVNWHLLTKDCSGKTRVAVLARFVNNMTEVVVNVDNFRMVRVNDAEVLLDGRPVTTSTTVRDLAGSTIMRLVRGSDMALQISLPQHGLKVFYANSTVLLYSDLGTRGRLCGICGDNDGNAVGELKNPRGNVEKTPKLFAASYRLPNTVGTIQKTK